MNENKSKKENFTNSGKNYATKEKQNNNKLENGDGKNYRNGNEFPNKSLKPLEFEKNYSENENYRITKNVVIIGIAFMIHFTAFHGTTNLQSSINSDAALGTTTLAIIYGSLILSNIFLPVTVIRWFGCKWAMAFSFMAYMPYIAAQFYPSFLTFIPAGLGVGFGGGPLWCAKCTYLSIVAEATNKIVGKTIGGDVTVVRYFAVFFVFYQLAQVWGNLISSSVLTFSTGTSSYYENLTMLSNLNEIQNNVGEICGANFCPGIDAKVNSNLIPPDPAKIRTLSGIFLICMAIAFSLIALFVDNPKRYGVTRKNASQGLTGIKLLSVTLKLLSEKYQLLILPITMFIGAEEAFIAVDFTVSFIACGWGISRIGFAMICFGISNAIAAGFAGAVAKYFGRISIMIFVYLLQGSLLIWMYNWRAVENDYISYCVLAAIWGVCDGIWLVNVNAFCGILFPKNEIAAYGNFRLWESTGSVIGYAISPYLCTSTKLLALIALMTAGMIGYGSIEFLERKQKGIVDRKNIELIETGDLRYGEEKLDDL
ncbi:UNC93-like protein [Condylostylus longicornis]|uniref:UNC93-like protein n=1 Tax=Condylostylus longicornis TaxID=2530218 RepID=UPI00244E2CB4|nr:UNC93-like protein [Condylostylus longicornis]